MRLETFGTPPNAVVWVTVMKYFNKEEELEGYISHDHEHLNIIEGCRYILAELVEDQILCDMGYDNIYK